MSTELSLNSPEARDPVPKYEVSVSGRGEQSSLTSDQRIHMCNNGGGSLAYDKNKEKFLDFQIRIVITYIIEG